MNDDPGIRIVLHLSRAGKQEAIEGWLRPEGEEKPQRFEGWLELLTLLQNLDHEHTSDDESMRCHE